MNPTAREATNLRTILCAVLIAVGTAPLAWASHAWATSGWGPSGQPYFGPGLICFLAWVVMLATHLPCMGFLLYSAHKKHVGNARAAHGVAAVAFLLLLVPVLYVFSMPG